jgi:membrane fusion protein, multidrug efflux system
VTTNVLDIPVSEPSVARRWVKPIKMIVGAAVVVTAGAWGGQRYVFSRGHVTTDNAQVEAHITAVSPKVQAFVGAMLVDNDRQVRAGDTLVLLDDRDLRVRLRQAEAELANAEAAAGTAGRAGQARAQLASSQAQAASAQAAVVAAEAAFTKATVDLERFRGLAAQKIISAQQLDAAQAAYDGTRATLTAARETARAAGSQVTAYDAAAAGANARLLAARAAVDQMRLQLSYAVITAPVDGVIAKRSTEPGSLVQIGQHLLSIVPNEMWVTANLKETELADIRVGDSVEFTIDAYGEDHKFEGKVESLSPATGARFALLPPDNASGNYTKVVQRVPVRIAVTGGVDSAHPLRPGMSAEVVIEVK